MYGRHRVSQDVRQRHLADSLDTLLEVYGRLKVGKGGPTRGGGK